MNQRNPHMMKPQVHMTICIINSRIENGELPSTENIDALGDAIDELHNAGYHEHAHKLDDAMCRWCELLL